jgi:hypothetical protein
VIADNKACVQFLDGPGWREAAVGHYLFCARARSCAGLASVLWRLRRYTNAITYRSASNHKKLFSLGSMASRPLATRLRSSHVRNIENSEEECSECGLNADHHSGEAKHENSRYEWVEQIAKI